MQTLELVPLAKKVTTPCSERKHLLVKKITNSCENQQEHTTANISTLWSFQRLCTRGTSHRYLGVSPPLPAFCWSTSNSQPIARARRMRERFCKSFEWISVPKFAHFCAFRCWRLESRTGHPSDSEASAATIVKH